MKTDSGTRRADKKTYIGVFVALVVLTVVTVFSAGLFAGAVMSAVIALAIALVKGGLVAAFFMHLAHERPIILGLVVFTVLNVAMMMGLITLSERGEMRTIQPPPIEPVIAEIIEEVE